MILSISELDSIQTYVSEKYSLSDLLGRIKNESFNDVIKSLIDETGKTFGNSWLYKYNHRILGSNQIKR